MLRQLIALDIVHVDTQAYNTLSITDAAKAFLRGNHSLRVREAAKSERGEKSASAGKSAAKDKLTAALSPAARNALAALKNWRASIAKEHNLPAYVIFHDATLTAIATQAPRNLDELSGVSGMGAKKLEAYGRAVLRVLDEASE